ncbi:complex I assembly factor ACAD9, mitochondrial isoform X2 [Helicoverpa zea]|uniref:complex I assembly factor ACAD9, mitochondrial isoform X1 n=1 Tax=Helicoverpa zea TaxID=7113 RepID=UPI001F56EC05|nr:complex I assembly factor ACAD9, mitochondrial isoform X1 [Helicoverpa zea]XP_047039294.1 complex I assembly factor ACAD9, mitochondrial isoform X2 [Helicoverpa zea]
MNIARKLCTIHHSYVSKNLYRKFRFSAINYESATATQPQVKEEKFNFEDLNTFERSERRKAKIEPFMKNIFTSYFDRNMLAYPEILNKEETEALEKRVTAITNVFSDPKKTAEDRKNILKDTKMYAAPISLTRNGLASNITESLRYLEAISTDFKLGQEMSDHWVGLLLLQAGLTQEQLSMIVDELITGDNLISLGIKERVAERISQADFRTFAEMDGQGVWRISGEKICQFNNGFILVLSTVEAERLKMFLVHPGAAGVSSNGPFVNFMKTPGTPLDAVPENKLAQILGLSRLYAASLSRCRLTSAIRSVVEYTRPRAFTGKPLADLTTIQSTIGSALLQVYASESAEYFTAGLLDGYTEPDAELEVAMCRNFIANHGVHTMLDLLSVPALDKEEECKLYLDNMRHLATRGENLDSVNMFIALTGLHHAGKSMAEEVKQMRNPLMHPTFIFRKVFANRHQEKDDPKLTLHLSEHLHPTLKIPSEQLEYCVLRMRYACETLMARHGVNVDSAYTELSRLAEAATEILVMTAVLARASRAYCIGLRNSEIEMKLAACFVEKTKERVKKLIKEIDDGQYLNLDHFTVQFGRKVLDTNTTLAEKPTARVFW